LDASSLIALSAVLALEVSAGPATPAQTTLNRDEAAELAALIATDLHVLLPQIGEARLAVAGALFDPVELLRPGFPVWAALDELSRRVPRGHLDNVVAFGTHEGRMPTPMLQPDAAYAGGPLRLLPLSLLAADPLAETLREALEVELIGRGEAGTRTADWLMRRLGLRLEHVRYLSRNDLLALTCVQYEHVNLAPLWTLLEAALLAADHTEQVLSARGLELQYRAGAVHVQSPAQWLSAQPGDEAARAHAFAGIVFELRQYASLLGAHGLRLRLADGDADHAEAGYLLETLADLEPGYAAPRLFAHEAPGLGVVAVTVAQPIEGGRSRALAHGYPLQPQALGVLVAMLADRYAIDAEVHALGRVLIDADGKLNGPATALH
jgi:hypothetical protein